MSAKQHAKRDHVNKAILSAFRKRWRRTTQPLLKDARILFRAFEAPSIKDQKSLAKAFYSKAHAAEMANSTPGAILTRLRPLCNYLARLPKRELTQESVDLIIGSEYLLFSPENSCDRFAIDLDDEICNWAPVSYPGNAMYDDWYERVGGFNSEFLGVLMKSTGESFSRNEQILLKQSVVENVTSEDHEELWVFDFDASGHQENQMIIYIARNWPKSHFTEPIAEAIEEMSDESILQFSERVNAMEQREKAELPSKLAEIVMQFGKTNNWKSLKRRLRSLLDAQTYEIRQLEDQLRPHIFGGRKYFHSTYNDGIDFF